MSDMLKSLKSMLEVSFPQTFQVTYVIEILILALIIYELMLWVKNTRAWVLLKGFVVIIAFALLAYIFKLTTITWLFSKCIGVAITAVFIVFQPELRRALEQLGRKNVFSKVFAYGSSGEELQRSTDKTYSEIVRAVSEMSKVKTGALIVMECSVALDEYVRTGIAVDAIVSSQLLINIFEHNTPLHDGAVFIRDQRVLAATCYLPLSDNMELSKELGTRHRAGVGISEVSDSLTIIVSEETGAVSIANGGKLSRNISSDELSALLRQMNHRTSEETGLQRLRGMIRFERKTHK